MSEIIYQQNRQENRAITEMSIAEMKGEAGIKAGSVTVIETTVIETIIKRHAVIVGNATIVTEERETEAGNTDVIGTMTEIQDSTKEDTTNRDITVKGLQGTTSLMTSLMITDLTIQEGITMVTGHQKDD